MVGLLEDPCFRMIELIETIGSRIVGLLEAPRFSYDWTFGGFPVFASWRLPGFRMVGVSEASRFSYG